MRPATATFAALGLAACALLFGSLPMAGCSSGQEEPEAAAPASPGNGSRLLTKFTT